MEPRSAIERQAELDAGKASDDVAGPTPPGIIDVAERCVTDLSGNELDNLAGEAWSSAASDALANGHSIAGIRDTRLIVKHPGGDIEDRGPVSTARQR